MRIHIKKSDILLYGMFIAAGLFFVFQAYGKSIEGLFLFNPSAGVIPFQVDASKTGRVDNLNADRVDDLHAADLMAAGGGGCYESFGLNTCAAGFTRVVDGFSTVYGASGSGGAGGLACSPIEHVVNTGGTNVLAISKIGFFSFLSNEACAICCNK